MKIAICEDRRADGIHLKKLLVGYLNANGLEAGIDIYPNGETLLCAFSPGKYQIVFMDIYLEKDGISGMDAAGLLRKADSEVSIIFTTTSVEHGPVSYEVKADYYIVKPVDKDRLGKALDRCRAVLDRYARTIEISTNWQLERIQLKTVFYAEVFKNNIVLHTSSGAVTARMPFGELLSKLDGSSFVQCHRSYVVNLIHVTNMQGNAFILKSGVRIAISRTYAQQASSAFKRFIFDSEG